MNDLGRTVAERLGDALQQLDSSQLGVVHIQLNGIFAGMDSKQANDGDWMLQFLLNTKDTRRRLTARNERTFAGVQIISDYIVIQRPDGLFLLEYFGSSIGKGEASVIHAFEFMHRLPSEVILRTNLNMV